MTELTREQIESFLREGSTWCPSNNLTKSMARMALRTHDAEHRAQRAEALLRRARPILSGQQRVSWQLVDDMDAALATPPPEGEPEDVREQTCRQWGTGRTVGDCIADGDCHEGCPQLSARRKQEGERNKERGSDVPHPPEQNKSYPLDSEGRCLKCGGTGRIGVDSTREPCPACTSTAPEQAGWYCAHCERSVDPSEVTFYEAHEACGRIITDDSPPQQTHGDALAALDEGETIEQAAPSSYDRLRDNVLNEAGCEECDGYSNEARFEIEQDLAVLGEYIRRHMTASGDYHEGFEEGMKAGHGVPEDNND